MTLEVKLLEQQDAGRWDGFVADFPAATFFHRAAWKNTIEQTFGHRCPYLYVEEAGEITGVLPLTHINSLVFGKALVSSAFCVYGGPVARTRDGLDALVARAELLAGELNVDHIEFRGREVCQPEWPCKSDLYVTFLKPMDPDPEANMLAIPRKQRAMVRKGIKAGLVSEIDPGVDRMYEMYSASVRNLGTPVFPKALFANLKQNFGEACEVLTITSNGEPVSAVMSFYFRDQVLPYYGGGIARARSLAANDFMYWELMRRACERGYKIFDFGRSKAGTGSYSFKKHWGFEPRPLHYEYNLRRGQEIPELNPLNPKYRLLIGTWKRLPLWLANRIGPLIARNLG